MKWYKALRTGNTDLVFEAEILTHPEPTYGGNSQKDACWLSGKAQLLRTRARTYVLVTSDKHSSYSGTTYKAATKVDTWTDFQIVDYVGSFEAKAVLKALGREPEEFLA